MTEKNQVTYKSAGVDIEAGERAVELMKSHVKNTFTPSVLANLGSFGAMFALDTSKYTSPVIVSSADGVGTKLKLAFMTDTHDTVGQCLVNHCTNDILVQGARALFFMDYFAVGKLDPFVAEKVVAGLSKACVENGCSLIGGETAEMPDMYQAGEYDLAGFIVGIVERDKIITGAEMKDGDMVIGLPSTGLHTNGYSLTRKVIFEVGGYGADDVLATGKSVKDELMAVHRSYANAIHPLLEENLVHGMAHITGGGLPGNMKRTIPEGLKAVIDSKTWGIPGIFNVIQDLGNVPTEDMFRSFNMGIGYTIAVDKNMVKEVLDILSSLNETPIVIGEITAGERGVEII